MTMQKIIDDLWRERRDIVSDGFDRALSYIAESLPLSIFEIPTGTECWSWILPPKWSVSEGWIRSGKKVLLDIADHPLHVMSYSQPVEGKINKDELMKHLHTYEKSPKSIPFEFSYYEKRWGFCTKNEDLARFREGTYEVCIKSRFDSGHLKVGEYVIPGKRKEEIVMVAHLCHPHMANDNLSGVAVLVEIARELASRSDNKYTYRFLFVPETIGSIAYLSRHEDLIPLMKYAIVIDCVGHDDVLSLQHSKQAMTEIDLCARHVLRNRTHMFREGAMNTIMASDEKVFNGPGVGIPTINLSRSRFWSKGEWPYPQYHSSDDTPAIIKPENLIETKKIVLEILEILNSNYAPARRFKGPLFLSRYGLWVDWRTNRKLNSALDDVMHSLEGERSILEIAEKLEIPYSELYAWLEKLYEQNLIEKPKG